MTAQHDWATITLRNGSRWDVSRDALRIDGKRINVSYADAEEWAHRLGALLPVPNVLDARWESAWLKNRPHTQQLWLAASSGKPAARANDDGAKHSAAIDADIAAALTDRGVAAPGVVGNVGKHWCATPAGLAVRYLYGWHVPRGVDWGLPTHPAESNETTAQIVQRSTDTSHGENHVDYSMTLVLMRPADDATDMPPTDPWQDPARSYAERCIEASYAELARGNLETRGHNTGPRIAEYFAPATRVIGGRETKLGLTSGDWCVAGGCFAGRMALLPGETLPHAYRVSGLEMQQDAQRLGLWRTRAHGYIPRPGDWRISKRGTEAWQRHGCRVIDADTSGERTIGANEGTSWRITERPASDPALLGYVSLPPWCHDRAVAPPVAADEPPDSGAPRVPGYIMWPEGKPGALGDGGMDEVAELIARLAADGVELVG